MTDEQFLFNLRSPAYREELVKQIVRPLRERLARKLSERDVFEEVFNNDLL
jgi:hypothetical protein